MPTITVKQFRNGIMELLSEIEGGYEYFGICSHQICFPLKAGGELRFMISEFNEEGEEELNFTIDLYDGTLPPGITGPAIKTKQKD